MTEERIDIVVTDKVDGGIRTKFQSIATAAVETDKAVTKLRKNLLGLNGSALSKLTSNITASATATNALARSQNALSASSSKAALAQQQLALAEQRTARATIETQIAQAKLNAIQNAGATGAARLATALNNEASSAQRLVSATNAAAISVIRLEAANKRAAQSTTSLGTAATGAAAAFAGYVSVGALMKTADTFTTIGNRIRSVTDNAAQFNAVQSELFNIARRSRSDLTGTVDAFVRFDKALKATGAGQRESLQFTETLNKALIASGRTTGEVTSIVTQLGQALTSGRLQGDEFRSLSENLPVEVLDAFAKELGVGRDELKKLSTEGKITAEVIRNAFANSKDVIEAAFAKSLPTIEQAFVVLGNSVTQYIGELDRATGISQAFSAAIMFVADNFRFFAPILAGAVVLIGAALVGAFVAATASVWAFTAALLTNPFGLIAVGLTVAIVAIYNFRDEIMATFQGVVAAVVSIWSGFPGAFMNFINAAISMAITAFENFVNYINSIFNGLIGIVNGLIRNFNQIGTAIPEIAPLAALVLPKPAAVGQNFLELGAYAGVEFQRGYNESMKNSKGLGGSGNLGGTDPLRPGGASTLGDGGGGSGKKGAKKLTEDQTALKKIYDETIGAVRQLVIDTAALNSAYEEGWLGLDEYNKRLTDLGLKAIELKFTMGDATWADVMLGAIGKVVEGYQGMLSGLSENFGTFFTSFTDGFANSIGKAIVYGDDLGESLREVARSALSELISGIVKLGIQWLIMNTIGASLQAAAVGTTAIAAGAAAAAWAPAAALASLATGGTNAAPAAAALTGTSALASTLAAVGGVGFMSGGYTGDGRKDKVAGAVHAGEYVFNADATKRIGVGNLEALSRNGRTAPGSSGNAGVNAGGMPKVTINNNGTPQDYQVQSLSRDEIILIARDQVRSQTPKVVAGEIANPNSRISKSLGSNTKTARNRP